MNQLNMLLLIYYDRGVATRRRLLLGSGPFGPQLPIGGQTMLLGQTGVSRE